MKYKFDWREILANALAISLSYFLMSQAGLSGFTHNPYQFAIWALVVFGLSRIFAGLILFISPRTTPLHPPLDTKAQENKAIVAEFVK